MFSGPRRSPRCLPRHVSSSFLARLQPGNEQQRPPRSWVADFCTRVLIKKGRWIGGRRQSTTFLCDKSEWAINFGGLGRGQPRFAGVSNRRVRSHAFREGEQSCWGGCPKQRRGALQLEHAASSCRRSENRYCARPPAYRSIPSQGRSFRLSSEEN